ncbi:glycosyltransferase family 2 protein, partial [candidate division KSB1 bacterium]|nr:glycosyltransferase family 2 protein [candidate division KSB1 bacterium]
MIDVSVVIPVYNESDSLLELHERLVAVVEKNNYSAEFIFIDDGSTDTSFHVLMQLHETDKRVCVSQLRRNYGKSAALAEGFKLASGRYVVTMDSDLQDDPAEIPHLIAKLLEGYDVVSGWKKKRYDPFVKRFTSKIFNKVTGEITGVHLNDMNCGLKIYRNEVVKLLRLYGQRHRFIPVLAAQNGFRIGELVVKHAPRKYGTTKFGPSRFLVGALDLLTLVFLSRYVKRPLHFFGGLGMMSFTLGFIVNLYLTFERILYDKFLSNRPLLFLGVLLIIVGVQFISIGLIGEMMVESRP